MSQNLVKIYDGRNGFWQWDKGQRLVVLNDAVTNVHLSHKGEKSSRELEIKLENSMRICDIPDVFLQIPKNLVVYAVEQDYKEACTITSIEFAVKTRPQPDGYMSVHDNEYYDINTRISSLEDAVGLGRPIDAELSMVSIRPVQNKVITKKINSIDEAISIIVDWQNEVNESMSHAISVEPQSLTEAQKAQARANIGAADFVPVDDSLSDTSKNPVQNKVVTTKINELNSGLSTVSSQAITAKNKADEAYDIAQSAGGTAHQVNVAVGFIQDSVAALETKVDDIDTAVLYSEQTLTADQKAQARANIGAETLIVEWDGENNPSHTSQQIYEHVQGGGQVYLKFNTDYYILNYSQTNNAIFELHSNTGVKVIRIRRSNVTITENQYVVTPDAELNATSTNPVQNKAIYAKYQEVGGMAASALQGAQLVDDKVTALKTQVNAIDGRVTELEDNGVSVTVDDKLDLQSTNPVQNKVVADAIATVGGYASSAQSGVAAAHERIDALEQVAADAGETFGNINQQIADLERAVDNAVDLVDDFNADIADHAERIDGLEKYVGNIEIPDGSITPEKTTFVQVERVRTSNNLLDKDTMLTEGHWYQTSSGKCVLTSNEYTTAWAGFCISVDGIQQVNISTAVAAAATLYNYFFTDAADTIIETATPSFDLRKDEGHTLTVPSGATKLCVSIKNYNFLVEEDKHLMVVAGNTSVPYEPYDVTDERLRIPNLAIDELETLGIVPIVSKNLFNKDAVSSVGQWVKYNNGLREFYPDNQYISNYLTSDNIPVVGGETYTWSGCGFSVSNHTALHSYAIYTDAGKYITGAYLNYGGSEPQKITMPSNAGYIVLNLVTQYNTETAMLELGDEATAFEPYGVVGAVLDGVNVRHDKILYNTSILKLPEKYDLVVGDTFELFYKGIMLCKDPYQYNILVSCDIGNAYGRKYIVTPTADNVGTHKLTVTVTDDFGVELAKKSVTLNVVNKATAPTENINVLCVGDSLTAGGDWVDEVYRRLTKTSDKTQHDADAPTGDGLSNITFVGKKTTANGAGYEGIGGWKYDLYIDPAQADNPFVYNGKVDFTAYCTDLGIDHIDLCYILLGWNMAAYTEDNFKAKAKAFIDLLIAHNANIKIVLVGVQMPFLDGLGYNYGASGVYSNYRALQEFVFNLDGWNKDLAAEYAANITSINLSGQFDTEYGTWTRNIAVNSRSTEKIEEQNNGVHPKTEGYYQIADAVYRKFTADHQ